MHSTRNGSPGASNKFDALETYTDITPFFREATQTLRQGELLHVANFTLLEGMTAVQIMDPKMDAGMLLPDTNDEEKCTLDEVKRLTLAPQEVLAIMDQMLALEVLHPATTTFLLLLQLLNPIHCLYPIGNVLCRRLVASNHLHLRLLAFFTATLQHNLKKLPVIIDQINWDRTRDCHESKHSHRRGFRG